MRFLFAALSLVTLTAVSCVHAEERFIRIDLGRDGAALPVYQMPHPEADATLILLPGGNGGTRVAPDGTPTSENFLVRARRHFHAQKFNVLIAFRPSDQTTLEFAQRTSAEHVAELERLIDHASRTFGQPVWLIGTSRGTISATAAAIALGERKVAGLVLTASVTGSRAGAVASQPIDRLRMPVLVVHHARDACRICDPMSALRIPAQLTSSPVKKAVLVELGAEPRGDPCEAFHWHGFINAEEATARLIGQWIRKPSN